MARYYGTIGFSKNEEIEPGIWSEQITTRNYSGDVLTSRQSMVSGKGSNSNILVKNTFSIISDLYADENFYSIKYITWRGVKWSVTDIEVQYPRLILTIGDVYNG